MPQIYVIKHIYLTFCYILSQILPFFVHFPPPAIVQFCKQKVRNNPIAQIIPIILCNQRVQNEMSPGAVRM